MDSNTNLNEINALYDARVKEMHQNQQVRNRLEGLRDYNRADFQKKYDSVPKELLRVLGLELTKPLTEYSVEELKEYFEKQETQLKITYGKIKGYLTTGEISDLGDLLSVLNIDNAPSQNEQVNEVESVSVLTEPKTSTQINYGDNSAQSLISKLE